MKKMKINYNKLNRITFEQIMDKKRDYGELMMDYIKDNLSKNYEKSYEIEFIEGAIELLPKNIFCYQTMPEVFNYIKNMMDDISGIFFHRHVAKERNFPLLYHLKQENISYFNFMEKSMVFEKGDLVVLDNIPIFRKMIYQTQNVQITITEDIRFLKITSEFLEDFSKIKSNCWMIETESPLCCFSIIQKLFINNQNVYGIQVNEKIYYEFMKYIYFKEIISIRYNFEHETKLFKTRLEIYKKIKRMNTLRYFRNTVICLCQIVYQKYGYINICSYLILNILKQMKFGNWMIKTSRGEYLSKFHISGSFRWYGEMLTINDKDRDTILKRVEHPCYLSMNFMDLPDNYFIERINKIKIYIDNIYANKKDVLG